MTPPQAPNVFPLMPCGPQSRDTVTLGCLAVDFTPSSLTFSWTQGANSLENITQYPSILKNDKYLGISQVQVSRQDWDAKKTFQCVANHLGERRTSAPITKPCKFVFKSAGCTQAAVDINIIGPTYRDILVKQSGKITCQIQVNNGQLEKIFWENQDNVEMAGTVKTEGLKKKEELVLDITYDEWHQGVERYCVVQHKDILFPFKIQYKRQKSGPAQRPSVFMLPPVEHAKNKEVTLTCSVKDFFPEEVYVAWLVDDDVVDSKYKTSTTSPVEKEGSYLVYSQLTLTDDQWKQSGVVYSCAVYHESITNSTRSIVRSIGFSTADKNNLVNLNLNISEKCKA
uniref:Ig-like domain-containing protein n=1 Tax=Oryzias sinensis TaxID=183150 RepID=A0A8C7X7C8_9TELE